MYPGEEQQTKERRDWTRYVCRIERMDETGMLKRERGRKEAQGFAAATR